MSEFWGRVHFWLSLIFMNLVFPADVRPGHGGDAAAHGGRRGQLLAGPGGKRDRRLEPGRYASAHLYSVAAVGLALAQVPFIINCSGASTTASRRAQTIPGKPRPWNGRPPRRRRTAISSSPSKCIAGHMNTACRATPGISRPRTNLTKHGHSLHS